MDLFNRMVKIEQMASRSNAASSASPHSPERATAHWRTVMEKVAEVMELARAQARVKGWQEDGFELGSRVPSSAVSAPPASAYSSPPATTVMPTSKEMAYAEMIKQGNYLGLRKCKNPPSTSVEMCSHHPTFLVGAGNQTQREVWCKQCHARWLVDPQAMKQVQSKTPVVQVGNTTIQMHPGLPAPTCSIRAPIMPQQDMNPPRTPPRKQASPPVTPVRTPWPPMSSLESPPPPSSLAATPVKITPHNAVTCKCGEMATQLQVKKSGPTQGRLFWKCARRVCDFFEGDPEETKRLQEELMKREEERKAQEFEQVIEKEKNEVINQTMAMAEQRHQALMLDQHVRHEMEKETLQN